MFPIARLATAARSRAVAVSLASTLATTGCTLPNFEGAQIQNPPDGFFLQPEGRLEEPMFDYAITEHTSWVNTAWGEFSVIYISGHPTRMDRVDVETARDAGIERGDPLTTFGEVEDVTIDGRNAWGWAERMQTERGLQWIAYRVAVPYTDMTYAIELYTGDPQLKQNPDTLRVIASSFGIGKVTYNLPLIAVAVGAGLFLVSMLRGRAHNRAVRMRNINLVQIPKREDEGGEGGEGKGKRDGRNRPSSPDGSSAQPPTGEPPAGGGSTPGGGTAPEASDTKPHRQPSASGAPEPPTATQPPEEPSP